jgi:hypothetical protein
VAFHSANGSIITKSATTLHTTNVTVVDGARLTENTGSQNASTNFDKVVADNSSNFDVPFDDTNIPTTDVGLNPGDKVTLVFTMGQSGKTSTLTNTTVERVEAVMNNEQDIVRCRVSTRGGVLTRPVT